MPFQVKFQLAYGGGLPQLPGLAGQVAACTLVFGAGPLAFARVLGAGGFTHLRLEAEGGRHDTKVLDSGE